MQGVVNLEQLQKHAALFLSCQMILNFDQVGQAISTNPGYLKLRKIRAAQNIARTVSFCTLKLLAIYPWTNSITIIFLLIYYDKDIE